MSFTLFSETCVALWLIFASVPLLVSPPAVRRLLAWLLPTALVGAALAGGAWLTPAQRLALSTLLLLYAIKAAVLLRRPRAEITAFSPWGLLIYATIWPGMDPRSFRAPAPYPLPEREDGRLFFYGARHMAAGLVAGLGLAVAATHLSNSQVGYCGIAVLLLVVHFGFAAMLTWCLRALGNWNVPLLFDDPLRSASLSDFWSRRWNRAFVEMNQLLFLRPLRRRFGAQGALLGIFAISGLLHEGGLSYPAGRGWGGPLIYFLLQGGLTLIETRYLHLAKRMGPRGRALWTWLCLLTPLPLLFHGPFRQECIAPLFLQLHRLLMAHSVYEYLNIALWLAGIGHFCVLIASFQVPSRLGWKTDLAKLTTFNRKIFWTYGGFIVLCIASFGTLTLLLHNEMLRGDRAALFLAGFNGVFWLTRIVVDTFFFRHDDWPKGPQFVLGHALLTSLFYALAFTYVAVIVYHLLLLHSGHSYSVFP